MNKRVHEATPGSPSDGEPQVLLWVIAVLIAVLELTWWLFDRMYST
jgi:hypothetical protein